MIKTLVLLVALALLFASSLFWALSEHNEVVSLQDELIQRDQVIVDRDTLITQLDTAIQSAESVLKLKPPGDFQYLTYQKQSNERQTTKIFLNETGASYLFRPNYPFPTPWINGSGAFSSRREFQLTNNRSIALSFWGWQFSAGGMYGGVTSGEQPALNVGVTVRNDYTFEDLGSYIGNRTGNLVSSLILEIRFYSWNGSIINVPKISGAAAPTASSNTAIGGVSFLLASGQTKQVIFYLSPSANDIETIDHYEIYVSSLSAY